MKFRLLFTITVLLLLTSINVYATSEEPAHLVPSAGPGHISFLQGDVQIRSSGEEKWFPATVNTPVIPGDTLWVPQAGRLELQLLSGAYVRLDAGTSVDVTGMDAKKERINISEGKAYVYFNPYEAHSLEISTSTTTVRPHKTSVFMMNVDEKGVTDVQVIRGEVYAEDTTGRRTLKAVSYDRNSLNEWENWNLDRDAALTLSASEKSYVPNRLRACAPGLSRHGTWIHTPHYGYVWTPTVSVGVDWSPYRDGKWMWIGDDYVWVSYEQWGWMPYHYGRWTHDNAFGWGWIPPSSAYVTWGPGFVGWVNTPEYVAWFPLGPGEVYYAYGNYGYGSVNITSRNVNFGNVDSRYRNFSSRAGLMTVPAANFHGGNYTPSAPNPNILRTLSGRNASTMQNVRFGRPNLNNAGAMAARMPVIRNIPNSALPPSRIAAMHPTTRGQVSPGGAVSGFGPGNRGVTTSGTSRTGTSGRTDRPPTGSSPGASQRYNQGDRRQPSMGQPQQQRQERQAAPQQQRYERQAAPQQQRQERQAAPQQQQRYERQAAPQQQRQERQAAPQQQQRYERQAAPQQQRQERQAAPQQQQQRQERQAAPQQQQQQHQAAPQGHNKNESR